MSFDEFNEKQRLILQIEDQRASCSEPPGDATTVVSGLKASSKKLVGAYEPDNDADLPRPAPAKAAQPAESLAPPGPCFRLRGDLPRQPGLVRCQCRLPNIASDFRGVSLEDLSWILTAMRSPMQLRWCSLKARRASSAGSKLPRKRGAVHGGLGRLRDGEQRRDPGRLSHRSGGGGGADDADVARPPARVIPCRQASERSSRMDCDRRFCRRARPALRPALTVSCDGYSRSTFRSAWSQF